MALIRCSIQLVADLADQVQDHPCQGEAESIWALGTDPSSALVGEIAVWRAANGINPQDPRADNTPQSSDRGARQMITPRGDGRTGSALPNLALSS
jgi:hypothetical protein